MAFIRVRCLGPRRIKIAGGVAALPEFDEEKRGKVKGAFTAASGLCRQPANLRVPG